MRSASRSRSVTAGGTVGAGAAVGGAASSFSAANTRRGDTCLGALGDQSPLELSE